ncbi:hypothetical protein Tco_0246989 [Tanacetum coccineum]
MVDTNSLQEVISPSVGDGHQEEDDLKQKIEATARNNGTGSGGNGSRMLGFVGGNGKLLCFIAAVGLQWAQLYVGKVTNGYKSNGGQMNKFATNVGVTSDSVSGPTSSQMLQVFCNDRPFVNLWYASSDDKACTFVGTAAYVPPEKLNSSHVTTGQTRVDTVRNKPLQRLEVGLEAKREKTTRFEVDIIRVGKLSWWYRVKSNTLTGEDTELRFFVCQASNLGGIE